MRTKTAQSQQESITKCPPALPSLLHLGCRLPESIHAPMCDPSLWFQGEMSRAFKNTLVSLSSNTLGGVWMATAALDKRAQLEHTTKAREGRVVKELL